MDPAWVIVALLGFLMVMALAIAQRVFKPVEKAVEPEEKPEEEPALSVRDIAHLRGVIDAAKAAELTLGDYASRSELSAALVLTGYRDRAAHAKRQLQAAGIEL